MNYHWYNEILRILCFLGLADLRCNIALSAATACPTRLELWAPRFQPLCDMVSIFIQIIILIKFYKQIVALNHKSIELQKSIKICRKCKMHEVSNVLLLDGRFDRNIDHLLFKMPGPQLQTTPK